MGSAAGVSSPFDYTLRRKVMRSPARPPRHVSQLPGRLPRLIDVGRRTFAPTGLFGQLIFRVDGVPAGWALKAISVGGRDVTDTPTWFEGRDPETVERLRKDGVRFSLEPGDTGSLTLTAR
jgi:hypothetical protein